MPRVNLRVVTIALSLFMFFAMRSGWYLLAGAIGVLNGLIMLLAKPPNRNRLAGAANVLIGGYILLLVLGFLARSAMAMTTRQIALYAGAALLVVGFQIVRRSPERRKLGLLLMALGALGVAYGLGYLG